MPKKMFKEIYKELETALTDRAFLREIELSKKFMIKLLDKSSWQEHIEKLMVSENLTCADVLDIAGDFLVHIDAEPEEGWLKYIENYTIELMFPQGGEKPREKKKGMCVFLRILRIIIKNYNEKKGGDFYPSMEFLTESEIRDCTAKDEYLHFTKFWEENYIYEFMLISKELTGFNTIGHIAGVHFVAVHIARQLKSLNAPIDTALVSAAAAGHDLGKYGCRQSEAKKIPYLHYYYTDKLFKDNHMPVIGHIAANHSTWDLELENLSVESLVLIYADFRVKSSRDENNREIVNFYTLKDSFDVILNKLDNVDEKKKKRYVRVYSKLKDFERFMESLGTSTDLKTIKCVPSEQKPVQLLNAAETVEKFKYMAIEHNIALMNKFNGETSFANLLEAARSEKQWKSIRAYLNIFSEYSTYMTQKQKLATLNFLYELLMHREGDIRRQAGTIMAGIIVNYDEEFRKELPENAEIHEQDITALGLWKKFLGEIVFPDYRVTEQHQRWIGYSLKTIIAAVLVKCETVEERENYLDVFFKYFDDTEIEDGTAFTLLGAVLSIPLDICGGENLVKLMGFAAAMSKREPLELKIGALRFAKYAVTSLAVEGRQEPDESFFIAQVKDYALKMMDEVKEEFVSVAYLKYKILKALKAEPGTYCVYEDILYKEKQIESDLYLENLKVGTPWVIKAVNIEFLLDKLNMGIHDEKLHIATHLSNLVKVSERVTVRHSAGRGLLEVIRLLSLDQRNEIIIELTKGLEIGEYQFSKYIPEYLGALAMYLHPRELDEFINDLRKLQDSTNSRVGSVTLDTLGVIIRKYPEYKYNFHEPFEIYEKRRERLLGMLLRGLASYDEIVSQEAFLVIGQSIFGTEDLSLKEKKTVFEIIYKKMLTLIDETRESEPAFYNSAAALNHIYRFISDYIMEYGDFNFKDKKKIAFFPGTFDPFSLSHKGIVQEIKKLGFEVYLALDEFSWSKKTQPRMIRKKIVSMSIADENDVYIFPENIPINIANPKDLKRLLDLFAYKQLYMVVGSDVVVNASSYKKDPEPYSIHYMNHIVFKRSSQEEGQEETEDLSQKYKSIIGQILELQLPVHLEDISSTRIRENIDNNRDISNLIDTMAQNYIYYNNLYLREPQYKSVLQSKAINFDFAEKVDRRILTEISDIAGRKEEVSENSEDLIKYITEKHVSAVIIRDGDRDNKPLGISLFHELDIVNLYKEFYEGETAAYIRENASGKIVSIRAISVSTDTSIDDLEQLILTETLAHCLKCGFTYAIYNSIFHHQAGGGRIIETLERQGFFGIVKKGGYDSTYFADMKRPIILFENMEMRIKSPFNKNEKVLQVLKESHINMQKALTGLYKGSLILSFNSSVMHHKLVNMITEENGVPRQATAVRKLGPYMCVPFGKILDGKAVPNTVTKTLHTEKVFDAEINTFKIKEYPHYATLVNQVKTIESFDRPILLVDDLLHKGYRIRELDSIFKQTGVSVEKIIVGLLSGRGKDLMAVQGREVESAYFIPNIKNWFVDDAMYPFIGGDSVDRDYSVEGSVLPSINLILPYAAPSFLARENREELFDFSMTCLNNAKNILKTLEEQFQDIFERNLTLSRLSEAVLSPRCPDKGYCVRYDEHLAASVYVENDIEKLMRLKNII